MKCELQRYLGELAKTLPTEQKKRFTFSDKDFPQIPDRLETDQLIIAKVNKAYNNSFKVDSLSFFANKASYQHLGLLILSVVFHPGGKRVHLELTEPTSDIKNLIIEYGGLTKRGFAYRTRPDHFLFFPEKVDKHPWTYQNLNVFDLPLFNLTNLNEFLLTEQDWASRDTVIGFGNDDASVMLAELLLRFGSPANEGNEVVLEGEGGFRGVGRFSAEASFHLPGSSAWPPSPPSKQ